MRAREFPDGSVEAGDITFMPAETTGGHVLYGGVTAHGGPSEPLQFDRLGSHPWPPAFSSRMLLRVFSAFITLNYLAD